MLSEVSVVRKRERSFLEGVAGKKLIEDEGDLIELICLCVEKGTDRVMLYAENLPEGFFDLKSGQAGMILQKFVNYRMKAAAVLPEDLLVGRFGEFVRESNRGRNFRVFQNRTEAEQWLLYN